MRHRGLRLPQYLGLKQLLLIVVNMVGAWEADPLIEGVTEVTDPEIEKEASHGVPDPLHEHDLDVHDLLETCSNCSSEHSLNSANIVFGL